MSVGGVGATGPSAVGLITNVLRKHQWSFIKHGCRCGDPGTVNEWPAHAAAVVDAALGGLTRELGAGFRGSQNITPVVKGLTASDFGPHWTVGERWVSGWTPEEAS